MSEPALSATRRRWLLWLTLLGAHVALWCGVFQCGFTREEVHALVKPGPYKLIEPYVQAAHRYGPIGVVRTYFFGESDDRLYLEYSNLVWRGTVDLEHVEKVQRRSATHGPIPARPWPYRDVIVEYPPLAFLAVLPPGLFSESYDGYRYAFSAFMLLLHLANLALAFALLRPTEGGAARSGKLDPVSWLLCASLAFSLLLGRIVAARMDHLVVTWTLGCLWAGLHALRAEGALRLRWAIAAGLLAACGVMTKLVPGLALLALTFVWLHSNAPDRLRLTFAAYVAGALGLAALNLPMFAFAGSQYLDTFRYHTLRGVQIESVYAGALLVARAFGLSVQVSEAFGSTNLDSCATRAIQLLSPWLFVGACAFLAVRRWPADAPAAVGASLALLLAFVITGRVFSPQYLIWIAAPLLAAAAFDAPRGPWRVAAALFLSLSLISQLIYPQGYPVLKAFHPLAIALLNLRNLGIIAVCVLIVKASSRTPQ